MTGPDSLSPRDPHSPPAPETAGTHDHDHEAAAHHAAHHAGRRALAFLVGTVGWLAAFAVIFVLLFGFQHHRERMKVVNDKYLARNAELKKEIDRVQGKVGAETEKLNREREEVDRLSRQAGKALQALILEARKLDKQAADIRAGGALPETPAPPAAAPVATDTAATVTARLQAEKKELLDQYVAAYAKLKTAFLKKLGSSDPEALRKFYTVARDTPLGPAALYFAGEKFRAQGRLEPALQAYVELSVRYPDSEYAPDARARSAAIRAGNAGRGDSGPKQMDIIPYLPLSSKIR